MHDEIIRYTIAGEIADRNQESTKERMIEWLETQMREEGVVPVLDLDPQFSREYISERNVFAFSLSVYGTFVGGERAWPVAGVMNGMTITRSFEKKPLP